MKRTITLKVDIPDTLEVQDMAMVTLKDKDGNEKEVIGHLSFPEFYDGDGNVVPDVARQFIEHVMAWNTEGKKENS